MNNKIMMQSSPKWLQLIGVALVVITNLAHAESVPLSIDAAIQEALANRWEMLLNQEQLHSADLQIKDAKGAFLPTVDFWSSSRRSKQFDSYSGVTVSGVIPASPQTNNVAVPIDVDVERDIPKYQINSRYEANLDIYRGGLNLARLDEAKANERQVAAKREATKKNLILEVATAYLELQKAKIQYFEISDTAKFSHKQADMAERMFHQGITSEIHKEEKLLTALEHDSAKSAAYRTLHEKLASYYSALGRPYEEGAAYPEELALEDGPHSIDVDTLLGNYVTPVNSDTLDQQPEIEQLRSQIDAAQARTKMARAELFPSVVAFGRLTEAGRDSDSFEGSFDDLNKDEIAYGVQVRWNLFRGNRTTHRIAMARSEEAQAKLNLNASRQTLNNLLWTQLSKIATLEEQLELANRQLQLAQRKEHIEQVRIQNDRSAVTSYESAQLASYKAANDVAVLEIDLLLARIALQLTSVQQ